MADYSSDSDSSVNSSASGQTPESPRSGGEGTPVSTPPSPPPPAKKGRGRPKKPKAPKPHQENGDEEEAKPKKRGRGRPPKSGDEKAKRAKKDSDDDKPKVKRARKTREVPPKPLRFVTDADNFLKYKAYIEYLLNYETAKQWAERMKKEKRRQSKMARDWKKKGEIDIAATVDEYNAFLNDTDFDFSAFHGKWLKIFGIKDTFSAKALKKVDLADMPIQFHAAYAIYQVSKKKGHKPLGIYAAKLEGGDAPEGESVYVGPRNSLRNMEPHELSLPTKLKKFVDRTDDMKLGVGEEDF